MKRKYLILYEYDDYLVDYSNNPVQELTKKLEENFNLWGVKDVHKKIPPHIKLKASFHLFLPLKEIIKNFWLKIFLKKKISFSKEEKLVELLEEFAKTQNKTVFSIRGINSFKGKLIFWNVESEKMKEVSISLCKLVKENFPEIILNKHEPIVQPHITLAKEFDETKFETLFKYIKNNFQLSVYSQSFDHFSLFVYQKGKYRRVKRFNLRA